MNTVSASTRRLLLPRFSLGFALVLLVAVIGCGGKQSASVKGTVKTNGQAVTGGTLVFSPVGTGEVGKPATATIGADGSYTLGTDRPGDGAVVGKHRVTFSPPEPQVTEEQRTNPKFTPPPPPYRGLAPKPAEVEVKAGSNTIDLELVPGGR